VPPEVTEHNSVNDSPKKWFIMSKGAIQGPYSSEDVESHLASITDALVWGRGLSEWLPPIEWRKNVQKQGHALTENTQDDLQWKYRVKGIEYGPYLYHDFLSSLKKLSDFSRVDIQGGGPGNFMQPGSNPNGNVYAGTLGAITATPSGNQSTSTSNTAAAYSNNSLKRSCTNTWNQTNGNITGPSPIQCALFGLSGVYHQTQFNPTIAKDNTKTLVINYDVSWSR
jgi:hypothetical protein